MRAVAPYLLLAMVVACQRSCGQGTVVPSGPASNIATGGQGPLLWKAEVPIDPNAFVPRELVRVKFLLLDVQEDLTLELEPVPPESLLLAKDEHAWTARLPGGDEAFFLRIGDAIEARVRIGGRIYRVRSRTRRIALFEVYDEKMFSEHVKPEPDTESNTPFNDIDPPPQPDGDSQCEDAVDQIDLLVLYTSGAAKASAAGTTAPDEDIVPIVNEIKTAVRVTNLAYEYSDVTHRLNLLGAAEAPEFPNDCVENTTTGELACGGCVEDATSGGLVCDWNAGKLLGALANRPEEDLEQMTYELDPAFNRIHALRESERADLVALVFEHPPQGICGAAKQPQKAIGGGTRHRAYGVVDRSCSVAYMSLAHEVGHNLGGGHNGEECGEYNCGYAQEAPSSGAEPWRTIMHRRYPCGTLTPTGTGGTAVVGGEDDDPVCWRIAHFSNPDIEYEGEKTGIENEADMARFFDESSAAVAGYRCKRSGEAANVWLKDVWDDEGGEPEDPAAVGKAMWRSPYIWVRHEPDPQRSHEHHHENPKDGTNYVYVKLHNNGEASETSTLEVYYAAATTNLDETEWKPIGAEPPPTRTIEPGVEVVEIVWENAQVPQDGSYGLLARWNIDGTPFEQVTSSDDLQGAVRADNDLIWRSNHLIELIAPPVDGLQFTMVGDPQPNDSYLLVTTGSLTVQELDWDGLVKASIELEPRFDHGGGAFARGLTPIGPPGGGKFELPLDGNPRVIGPFPLGRREPTAIKLRIATDSGQIKDAGQLLTSSAHYDITFMQLRPDAVGPDGKLVGNPSSLLATKGWVVGGISYALRILPTN